MTGKWGMALIGALVWTGGAAVACEVPEPDATVRGWKIEDANEGYLAVSTRHEDLAVDLFMQGPGRPEILHFSTLPRYARRLAVLRYFAGEPGTSYTVKIVDQVVIDMATGQEIARGTWSENCTPVRWVWEKDAIEIDDPAGYQLIYLD